MRVAIFAVSSLSIAWGQASHAQVLQAADAAAFNDAVPAVAMNSQVRHAPELVRSTVVAAARRHSLSAPGSSNVYSGELQLDAARLPPASVAIGSVHPRGLSPALRAPQRPVRGFTDHLLAGAVALMLIAYQLRRKHRVLRPHPFTT